MSDKMKQLRVSDIDGITVIRFINLNCARDELAAQQLGEELLAVAQEQTASSVIMDFENLEFVPAAIVEGKLVRFHKALDGQLVMCNVPAMVMEHFERNRLATIFKICSSFENAVASMSETGGA